MHRPSAVRVIATGGTLGALLAALHAATAIAGGFVVASCQADRVNFSTIAFQDFATRGMRIRRACNPEGPGMRGLITANATGRTAVPRGSVAMATISAPSGTRFTSFRWAGTARRSDCRYALQLYAEGPGIATKAIKNVRANTLCAGRARTQAAGYRSRIYNVSGATRIVQRVICIGSDGRTSCSGRGTNYIRTYQAEVGVIDELAPTAAIHSDTPLATGAWVRGSQPLNYVAQDNVGVRSATAVASGSGVGADQRGCLSAANGAFPTVAPCPNGPGQIAVKTAELPEGTQQLVVQAQDPAGNVGQSAPVLVRVDNRAPSRVAVGVEGGDAWRNRNDFAVTWTNPVEGDRAPIVAAEYKLCAAAGGACQQGERAAADIGRLPVQVPVAGEWTVGVWRRDAAGNADPGSASEPVTLRYDPEPPQLAFGPPSQSDPTLVSVPVVDAVSGLAGGRIEISAAGSATWRTLGTQQDGSRLTARIDDVSLRPGAYLLRATAYDHASNEASTSLRSDGQPMAVTLPLRIASVLRAGVARERIVRRIVRRGGKRRVVRRRVTELRSRSVVRLGRQAPITGRLTNRDGQGIAGAQVQVLAANEDAPEQLVGVVQTDASGSFGYTAAGTTSRTLRFAYLGSPLILPAQSTVRLVVAAVSTLRVSRQRVLNGQSVTFSGQVRSLPVPTRGKFVQLEVRLSGRWRPFRTTRTDQAGRWSVPYRFTRTRGTRGYRFRVALPVEAGYPFGAGASRSLRVHVRGRS